MRGGVVVSGLVAALSLMGCGADRDDAVERPVATTAALEQPAIEQSAIEQSATTAPAASQWVIQSFEFVLDVAATAGEPIQVVNRDGADHTLTDEAGLFEAYVDADDVTLLTIEAPGTYAVWCRIHPDMRGTIVVEPVP